MPIKRLWELNPEEYKALYSFLKNLPIPGEFDSFGLRFSKEHLREMKGKIILLPMEFMALYEDIVIHQALVSNDIGFLSNRLLDIDEGYVPSIDQANTTSIGNLAAIANSCREGDLQKRALVIINSWYDEYVSKYGTSLV